MNRIVLGAFVALIFVSVGLFWLQGRAEVAAGAPPPGYAGETSDELGGEGQDSGNPEALLETDVEGMLGPSPPVATRLTREQRRFGRYDSNRDGRITRNEMLSTRTGAFRDLDKDGNNLLTFEEWAVATAEKFDKADGNRDRELSPAEFATTRSKSVSKPKCDC